MPYRKRPSSDKGLYALHNGEGFAVRWIAGGKLQFKRLLGASKTEARKWRNQQIADADRGRTPVTGRLTFADLVRMKRTHRSEEHTSELQSQSNLVCRLLLEKKKSHTT